MSDLGHTLTIGQTLSGKTVLNKRLSGWFQRNGIKTVVLDPMMDPEWHADYMTSNAEEFLAFVRNPDMCQQCALFVDESGMSLDKYAEEYQWLTCQSRHHGHVTHLIAQRAQQVNATTRAQCSTLYMFNVSLADAKIYMNDFNFSREIAEQAPTLAKGEFFRIARFGGVQRLRLW